MVVSELVLVDAEAGGVDRAPVRARGDRDRVDRDVVPHHLPLSIGHVSPEAAEGGPIGLGRDGDTIEIDIPNRSIRLAVDDAEIARRRAAQDTAGWQPAEPRA